MAPCCPAGLHGAKLVISGRRESVLQAAVDALSREGLSAHYVQVNHAATGRGGGVSSCGQPLAARYTAAWSAGCLKGSTRGQRWRAAGLDKPIT